MAEARTALITGGASGFGRATLDRMLAEGWNVVVADFNAAAVAKLNHLADTRVVAVRADVCLEEDVRQAVATAVERFGSLDCVVNNAGVGGAFGPITDLEVEDWDYTFAVLARGVMLGTKHGARAMKAAGRGGVIVNTASIAGVGGGAAQVAYSAAKAAVLQLTRFAAVELAPDRIRVNSVSPGVVRTSLLESSADSPEDLEATLASVAAVQPWPEPGRPQDIASVIVFLASDDAAWVTGENIVVDGGLLAAGPRLFGVGPENTEARNAELRSLRGLVGVNRGSTGLDTTVRRPT